MCIAVPWILPVLVPLLLSFLWVRARYLATSREVKRFDAVTRSPVYAAFSATLKVGRPVNDGFWRSFWSWLEPLDACDIDARLYPLMSILTIACRCKNIGIPFSTWMGLTCIFACPACS